MKNTRISHIEDYLLEISQEINDVKFKLVELKKNLKVLLKSEKKHNLCQHSLSRKIIYLINN